MPVLRLPEDGHGPDGAWADLDGRLGWCPGYRFGTDDRATGRAECAAALCSRLRA